MSGLQHALPQGFVQSIAHLLPTDMGDFLHSFEELPSRALRFSARRKAPQNEWCTSCVPWAINAYYLRPGTQPGAHPLHWAGVCYIQEPSAMAAAAALNPQPGERVLDLCAAPGGKATQLADMMRGRGVLIANDPVLPRARELSRNIERMGIKNAVVLSNTPSELARSFPETFDRVLVDAPCSGEGMFRKDPLSRRYWTAATPALCAARQKEILCEAERMLKPGGTLVYSTCTFNDVENEGVLNALLQSLPDVQLNAFTLPGLPDALEGMLRLWPHRVQGEGHFIAMLKKRGELEKVGLAKLPAKIEDQSIHKLVLDWVMDKLDINDQLGDTFVQLPAGCPPLTGFRVLRAGLHIAQRVGKTIRPDHALALAGEPRRTLPLTLAEADAYRRGEVLSTKDQVTTGFVAPSLDGWPLGWAKASDAQLKNHYPKGLRKYSMSESENYV